MIRLFAILLLLSISPLALGSCVVKNYRISGTVKDREGFPVAGAIVGASWIENFEAAAPALATTDAEGKFVLKVRFNTFTGTSEHGGDTCRGKLHAITVTACAGNVPGYSRRLEVSESQHINGITVALWRRVEKPSIGVSCVDS